MSQIKVSTFAKERKLEGKAIKSLRSVRPAREKHSRGSVRAHAITTEREVINLLIRCLRENPARMIGEFMLMLLVFLGLLFVLVVCQP